MYFVHAVLVLSFKALSHQTGDVSQLISAPISVWLVSGASRWLLIGSLSVYWLLTEPAKLKLRIGTTCSLHGQTDTWIDHRYRHQRWNVSTIWCAFPTLATDWLCLSHDQVIVLRLSPQWLSLTTINLRASRTNTHCKCAALTCTSAEPQMCIFLPLRIIPTHCGMIRCCG